MGRDMKKWKTTTVGLLLVLALLCALTGCEALSTLPFDTRGITGLEVLHSYDRTSETYIISNEQLLDYLLGWMQDLSLTPLEQDPEAGQESYTFTVLYENGRTVIEDCTYLPEGYLRVGTQWYRVDCASPLPLFLSSDSLS